jgi:hypothetical protein
MTECSRIADQLRRAFGGDAWHGPPLSDILSGITAQQAAKRVLPAAHTIWEVVVHIDVYLSSANSALDGIAMPHWYGTGADWPEVVDSGPNSWAAATQRLFENAEQLARNIESVTDTRLTDVVPGREYDFYYLLHGIVQHSLYHAGQIAMLKNSL